MRLTHLLATFLFLCTLGAFANQGELDSTLASCRDVAKILDQSRQTASQVAKGPSAIHEAMGLELMTSAINDQLSATTVTKKSCGIPPEKRSEARLTDPSFTVDLTGQNSNYHCGFYHLLQTSGRSQKEFEKAIQETNWDPCCLTNDIKNYAQGTENPTNGLMFGAELGINPTIPFRRTGARIMQAFQSIKSKFKKGGVPTNLPTPDAIYGREVVFIKSGPDSIQLAAVDYVSGGLSLSTDVGASLSQGVLNGNCSKIDDYLGWFQTKGVLGFGRNVGYTHNPNRSEAKPTGCNSNTNITGLTTTLASYSESYYERISPVVEIKGPRAVELIRFLEDPKSQISKQDKKACDYDIIDHAKNFVRHRSSDFKR